LKYSGRSLLQNLPKLILAVYSMLESFLMVDVEKRFRTTIKYSGDCDIASLRVDFVGFWHFRQVIGQSRCSSEKY